ncbi:MAG: YkgJ family cysteine cluster protein [Nitrospinae bacterium]|nr:YkgJ family cysteine cluster protein [Nitrospinota bacterium]
MDTSSHSQDDRLVAEGFHAAIHEAVGKLPRIGWGETFRFKCHKGLSCWTQCCRNPGLFLTPYDVLRLKKKLNIKSAEFLEKHTATVLDPQLGLPVTRLLMNKDGACPFVSAEGCSVYADRPTSCRIYPLGQAASSGVEGKPGEHIFFKVEEDYCKGWGETSVWKLEDWVLDQGAAEYNVHNEILVKLAFHPAMGEPGAIDERKLGMIHMALFDLDTFRKFIFETTFLKKFAVDDETLAKIRDNDEDLLRFAVRWLEFSVLGSPTMEPKSL